MSSPSSAKQSRTASSSATSTHAASSSGQSLPEKSTATGWRPSSIERTGIENYLSQYLK
jgi:hypothetical protein